MTSRCFLMKSIGLQDPPSAPGKTARQTAGGGAWERSSGNAMRTDPRGWTIPTGMCQDHPPDKRGRCPESRSTENKGGYGTGPGRSGDCQTRSQRRDQCLRPAGGTPPAPRGYHRRPPRPRRIDSGSGPGRLCPRPRFFENLSRDQAVRALAFRHRRPGLPGLLEGAIPQQGNPAEHAFRGRTEVVGKQHGRRRGRFL